MILKFLFSHAEIKRLTDVIRPVQFSSTSVITKINSQNPKRLLVDSFNESFEREELSYTQNQGVIILLHKGKYLDRERLSNWRPITLTNSDYKILAKVLARRMGLVINELISVDQVGYLKDRNISTVIRTIDDAVNYLNVSGKAGYLLALDFKKSFRQYIKVATS